MASAFDNNHVIKLFCLKRCTHALQNELLLGLVDLVPQLQGFVPRLPVPMHSGHHLQVLSSIGGGQGFSQQRPMLSGTCKRCVHLGVSAELGIRAVVFDTPT